jgi:putative CocE/NonD family hydrolase
LCSATDAAEPQLPSIDAATPVRLQASITALANKLLQVYRNEDRPRYLETVFLLQLAAGRPEAALDSLRELTQAHDVAAARLLPYEIEARARIASTSGSTSYKEAYGAAFRTAFGELDDLRAGSAAIFFAREKPEVRAGLREALSQSNSPLSLAVAVDLVRQYALDDTLTRSARLVSTLLAQDDARRYFIEDVLVKTRDGAAVSVLLYRPKNAGSKLPTAFEFTIYAGDSTSREARWSAAHGYIGAVATTRGKRRSPNDPVPYEHDGSDARDVIEWIAAQPWSDGKVGMYGGSYNGFTQWAAARYRPAALKAIMPSAAALPGFGEPMEGGVMANAFFRWLPYVLDRKTLAAEAYWDDERWNSADWNWFGSKRPYRKLFDLGERPGLFLQRWLDHPTYDAYWQAMTPQGRQFAAIDIPVLTTTGYYDGGMRGALRYLTQHLQYRPTAEHYLVIGPYSHIGAQRRSQPVLQGYAIDPVAQLDVEQLRYQWLDYTLRGAQRPTLLKDRINYQVMGANLWRSARSLEELGTKDRQWYLAADVTADMYCLCDSQSKTEAQILLHVDLSDRNTLSFAQPRSIIAGKIDTSNAVAFASQPFEQAVELSGFFAANLQFVVNKRDFDFYLSLYQETPKHQYFHLSYYLARASQVRDPSRRQLLNAGKPQSLSIQSGRMTSRLLEPGSRLILVFGIPKNPRSQVNYGTGKDVSDETASDAGEPLEVLLQSGSSVRIPMQAAQSVR